MSDFPSFGVFYEATHRGRPPLPWQRRLAEHVAEQPWPAAVGVPTGLGKTACLDIAVWALARQHDRPPSQRTLPTRIWYVVNRRLLVDAAYDHGQALRQLLADPGSLSERWPQHSESHMAALHAVGGALRAMAAMGSEHGPLHVARLRGGAAVDARVPDPSQPALIFATVPMFASRWLFQGYGSSASMRPIDAALAGIDSLVLVDESHIARPLIALRSPLAECDLGQPGTVVPAPRARPTFVELTATGDTRETTFDLDDEDRHHPVVRERLGAAKPTSLVETSRRSLAQTLADAALDLLAERPPSAAVVFVNTARGARDVFQRLVARASRRKLDIDAVLLTGRVRDRDGDGVRARLLDPDEGAPAERPTGQRGRHLVVVATQTLEVGADLDFDVLVTETAGTRALVQRFGRLNRMGRRNDTAAAVICHPKDVSKWPVYGMEPAQVWQRLHKVGDQLDLGPGAISEVLGAPRDAPARVGEILPVHLWEWAKTSAPPPDMAPIEPFVEGFAEDVARVIVAWRAHLPAATADAEEQAQLFPRLRAGETVELPLRELRDALQAREIARVHRLVDGAALEVVDVTRLRPGDQVILPVSAGLYDQYGWNPDATGPVLDLSPLESRTLILDTAVLRNVLSPAADETLLSDQAWQAVALLAEPEPDTEPADLRGAAQALLSELHASAAHPAIGDDEWHAFLDGLADLPVVEAGLPPHLPPAQRPRQERVTVAADAFDELSFTASSVDLDQHLGTVGESAERIVRALGGPPELAEVANWAGRHHDLGKVDSRFQRWLDPDGRAVDRKLAKSSSDPARRTAARIASGWPRGGRHELLSARLVAAWLDERGPVTADDDLLLHLVISHHGHGRPSVAVVADPYAVPVVAEIDEHPVKVSGDLSQHDWSQPRRFRALCERYGYWGLALLEAVVRQADHAASAQVVAEVV